MCHRWSIWLSIGRRYIYRYLQPKSHHLAISAWAASKGDSMIFAQRAAVRGVRVGYLGKRGVWNARGLWRGKWVKGLSRWWFQLLFIFTPFLGGNDPIWRGYVSNGLNMLKPPTTGCLVSGQNKKSVLKKKVEVTLFQKCPQKNAVKIIHYIPVSPCDSAVTSSGFLSTNWRSMSPCFLACGMASHNTSKVRLGFWVVVVGWFPGASCGEVEGDGHESYLDPLTFPIFLVSLDPRSKTNCNMVVGFFCLEMLSFLECKSYVWVVVNPNQKNLLLETLWLPIKIKMA